MNQPSEKIKAAIKSKQDPKKASWLESYVKHNIKSLGVGIPNLREIVKKSVIEFRLTEKPISYQNDFLDDLMQEEYAEYKLAAILYIQLFWNGRLDKLSIEIASSWFDKGWIYDWNVCDWLCVKILTQLIDRYPDETIKHLKIWNQSKYLWKARASLVPFAQCKTIENHIQTIQMFAINLIKRDERFCKTAVGWVLREYSKTNPKFVTEFLKEYNHWTSAEVIKNANKYLDRK